MIPQLEDMLNYLGVSNEQVGAQFGWVEPGEWCHTNQRYTLVPSQKIIFDGSDTHSTVCFRGEKFLAIV